MNINNQPSFGASFRWSTSGMAQKVSKNMDKENFEALSAKANSLKAIGGDNVEHVLLPNKELSDSNYEPSLVNKFTTYVLQTMLEKKDGNIIHMTSGNGGFSVSRAQSHLDALLTAEKHNLSQDKIDEFESPEDIVKYGKALDLEG